MRAEAGGEIWHGATLHALAAKQTEDAVLSALYTQADADGDGLVGGADAILFFKPSGLPNQTLSSVWLEASKRRGYIDTVDDFALACQGVAQALLNRQHNNNGSDCNDNDNDNDNDNKNKNDLAAATKKKQNDDDGDANGHHVNNSNTNHDKSSKRQNQKKKKKNNNKKNNKHNNTKPESSPLGSWNPAEYGSVADVYASISSKDRAKYKAHFVRADKSDAGTVGIEEARVLFGRAKIPVEAIDSIFNHCCTSSSTEPNVGTMTGSNVVVGLDLFAFSAAMHLVYAALRAKLAVLLDTKANASKAQQSASDENNTDDDDEIEEDNDQQRDAHGLRGDNEDDTLPTDDEQQRQEREQQQEEQQPEAVASFPASLSPPNRHPQTDDATMLPPEEIYEEEVADNSATLDQFSSDVRSNTFPTGAAGATTDSSFPATFADFGDAPAFGNESSSSFGCDAPAFSTGFDGGDGALSPATSSNEGAASSSQPIMYGNAVFDEDIDDQNKPHADVIEEDDGFGGDFTFNASDNAAFEATFPPAEQEQEQPLKNTFNASDNAAFEATSPPAEQEQEQPLKNTFNASDNAAFEATSPPAGQEQEQQFVDESSCSGHDGVNEEISSSSVIENASPAANSVAPELPLHSAASPVSPALVATSESRGSVSELSKAFESPGVAARSTVAPDLLSPALVAEVAELKDTSRMLDAQIKEVAGDTAAVRAEERALVRESEDLKAAISAKQVSLFESKKVLGELEQSLVSTRESTSKARAESQALQEELNALKIKKLDTVRAIEDGAKRAKKLPAAQDVGAVDNAALRAEIDAVEAEVTELQVQLDEVLNFSPPTSALHAEPEMSNELKALIAHKERIAEELAVAIEAQQSKNEALNERAALGQDALAVAESMIKTRRTELANLRAMNDALEHELKGPGVSVANVREAAEADALDLDNQILAEKDRQTQLLSSNHARSQVAWAEFDNAAFENMDSPNEQLAGSEMTSGKHRRGQSSGTGISAGSEDDFIVFNGHNRQNSTTGWAFDAVKLEDIAATAGQDNANDGDARSSSSGPQTSSSREEEEIPHSPTPSSTATSFTVKSPYSVVKTGESGDDDAQGFSSFLYGGAGETEVVDSAAAGATENGFGSDSSACPSTFGDAPPDFGSVSGGTEAPPTCESGSEEETKDEVPPPSAPTTEEAPSPFGADFFSVSALDESKSARSDGGADGGRKAPESILNDSSVGASPFGDDIFGTPAQAATVPALPVGGASPFGDDIFAIPQENETEKAGGENVDCANELLDVTAEPAAAPAEAVETASPVENMTAEVVAQTYDPAIPPIDLADLMPKKRESAAELSDDDLFGLGSNAAVTTNKDRSDSVVSGLDFLLGEGAGNTQTDDAASNTEVNNANVDDIFASLGGESIPAPPSPVEKSSSSEAMHAAVEAAVSTESGGAASTTSSSGMSIMSVCTAARLAGRVSRWKTLSNTERLKCEKTFNSLVVVDKIPVSTARAVFKRICKHEAMFDAVWALAAEEGVGQQEVTRQEFYLFLHLSKQLARKGATLPTPPLTPAERSHLMGANRRRSNASTPATSAHGSPPDSPRQDRSQRAKDAVLSLAAAAGGGTSTGLPTVPEVSESGGASPVKAKKRVPKLKPKSSKSGSSGDGRLIEVLEAAVPAGAHPSDQSVAPPKEEVERPEHIITNRPSISMISTPSLPSSSRNEPDEPSSPPLPTEVREAQVHPPQGPTNTEEATISSDPRISALTSMGFSASACAHAVAIYGANTDACVNFLVENPNAGAETENVAEEASPVVDDSGSESVVSPASYSGGDAFAADSKTMSIASSDPEGGGANAGSSASPTSRDTSSSNSSGFRLCVDKVTLKPKDANRMSNPFWQISLSTAEGRLLERQQKTSPNVGADGPGTLLYGPPTAVSFKSPPRNLPKDAAVYFELMHYKADKQKNSCMAWSYAPVDMIKTGKFSLPLFEKPIDVSRRRTKRINKKELDLVVSFAANATKR